jgi:copper chaperone CopZ
VSVALRRVDGVTAVSVTLGEGHAKVTLKPGNTVTLADVRRVIERNGFTPRSATVVAEAEEIAGEAQPKLRISGTTEAFLVSPASAETVRADLRNQSGKRVIVEGVVPPAKDYPSGVMELKSVKPTGK